MDRCDKHTVIFQPAGSRGRVAEGVSLLEASRVLGVELAALCGGQGSCGKCQVRMQEGFFPTYGLTSAPDHLSPFGPLEEEFIGEERRDEGYRLACAAHVRGDVVVFVPEETRAVQQDVRKEATVRHVDLWPAVRSHRVMVGPAAEGDPPDDFGRLSAALGQSGVQFASASLPALTALPDALRGAAGDMTAWVWDGGVGADTQGAGELLHVAAGAALPALGMAVDLGTTTVAAYLCRLDTGELVATGSLMNPQVAFGEDVMSRIGFATSEDNGLSRLRQSLLEGLNALVERLTRSLGRLPSDILDATVVGNTVMHHIFLGISPRGLGLAPYSPALRDAVTCRAAELGLKLAPAARVYVLPVVAGFVGADTMGVVIAEEPFLCQERSLTIDIGTNGELVMGNRQRLMCASCATGPAFEGAHIAFGMRAARGAIERVAIDPDGLEPHCVVIGAERARGICGSGVIDCVAQMYMAGIIDHTGRFVPHDEHPRIRRGDEGYEYVVAWARETAIERDIAFTQKDVRAVQLGKAALFAGARVLMRRLGYQSLDRVVLAGAFGTYIDRENALVLGMYPAVDLSRVTAVGNAAGDGARLALLDVRKRREAEYWARRLEYVELSLEDMFQREFVDAIHFPPLQAGKAGS